MYLAAISVGTQRSITLSLFGFFVLVTLGITIWASRRTHNATDFYAGGRAFSGLQNGMAISGDYMSAASFLGIAGLIALNGYDGFLYSIGFLVAWLVALLLVAELMRNSGKYTMADVLAFRMRQAPVRTAASVSTVVVSIFYLLAQMVGAGTLVNLLLKISKGTKFLGMTATTAQIVTIILVGALMIIYVTFGGMKGTTYVQIVKAFLLMGGALIMTVLVLWHYKGNISSLLGDASAHSLAKPPENFLKPGQLYGKEVAGNAVQTFYNKMDLLSLGLALVLGTAGLPHILIRFYTVPSARIARRSVLWAIGIIGTFYLFTLALGFGAAALVTSQAVKTASAGGNTAAPQLAQVLGEKYFGGELGGVIFLAVIAAVAFATILAVVAGLTLASSSSVAHDVYANVIRKGKASERQEVVVARGSALVIGAIAICLGILARDLNVAFLVALAFAVAASGNLPAILYSLFWKRFNTVGATSAIYGGLIAAVVLVVFSPTVSGATSPIFPHQDFHFFPLTNPGIISIPFGFLCGWLGTMLSSEKNPAKYAELEVRSLTGVGAAN
jgi:cation/acetate symporter